MSVLDLMTPEQRERAKESMAMTLCQQFRFPIGSHPQQMAQHFHQLVGIPVSDEPMIPSVSERLLRGRLLLEEVLKTFKAMGLTVVIQPDNQNHDCLVRVEGTTAPTLGRVELQHIEGSRYDVVETADGLSDINFVVNGTAAVFGIPICVTDYEVYSSNLTKVRPDGTVIINGVTPGYEGDHDNLHLADDGFNPKLPVGKVLKPDNFVPANIPAALAAYEKGEW